jgi:hypothetical protein
MDLALLTVLTYLIYIILVDSNGSSLANSAYRADPHYI